MLIQELFLCRYTCRRVTLHFNGGGGGGRAVIVNGDAGVDPGILRHQITDLQQDVACVPGGQEEGKREGRD